MRSGTASTSEIRILLGVCKDLGDRPRVREARDALAQKQE
jgi:hypothetical protein